MFTRLFFWVSFFFLGMFDQDNSGAIEFNEFYALWQYVTDWQRTFRSYDQDNSGTIDRQELKTGNAKFVLTIFLSLRKQPSFIAPGPSGVSKRHSDRERRLKDCCFSRLDIPQLRNNN